VRGFLVAATALVACSDRPDDAQLGRWLLEAETRNAAALMQFGVEDWGKSWTVTVEGAVERRLVLDMRELDALATTKIRTANPAESEKGMVVVEYRGVPIATLLERAGARADAIEITAVGFDAFRSPFLAADARRYPGVMLAIERDGAPIPRGEGGPVHVVFPWTDHPAKRDAWPGRLWCWYTTHLIVDTELPRLAVAERTIDAASLAALPPTSIRTRVGYKLLWPTGDVLLHGVRLRDLLPLARGQRIVARGKARKDREGDVMISADEALDHDIIVATHWGEERRPIPASMGGPLTLAYPNDCEHKHWITFLEALELAP
jgi:hypothetical protein